MQCCAAIHYLLPQHGQHLPLPQCSLTKSNRTSYLWRRSTADAKHQLQPHPCVAAMELKRGEAGASEGASVRKDGISDPQGQWLEGKVIFGFRQSLSGWVKRRSPGLAIKKTRPLTLTTPEIGEIEHWDPENSRR